MGSTKSFCQLPHRYKQALTYSQRVLPYPSCIYYLLIISDDHCTFVLLTILPYTGYFIDTSTYYL